MERKDWLVLVISIALGVGSLVPKDPVIVLSMLFVAAAGFIWLCVLHLKNMGIRVAACAVFCCALAFVGWRDLKCQHDAIPELSIQPKPLTPVSGLAEPSTAPLPSPRVRSKKEMDLIVNTLEIKWIDSHPNDDPTNETAEKIRWVNSQLLKMGEDFRIYKLPKTQIKTPAAVIGSAPGVDHTIVSGIAVRPAQGMQGIQQNGNFNSAMGNSVVIGDGSKATVNPPPDDSPSHPK